MPLVVERCEDERGMKFIVYLGLAKVLPEKSTICHESLLFISVIYSLWAADSMLFYYKFYNTKIHIFVLTRFDIQYIWGILW